MKLARRLLSFLSFALALFVLYAGFYARYFATEPNEPLFGPDQGSFILLIALIISPVIFLVAYILWPKLSHQ